MYRDRTIHRIAALSLITICAIGAACSAPPRQEAPAADLDVIEAAFELLESGEVQLVDLSWPLSPEGLYWPTGAPFEHEVSAGISEGGYWYASGSFSSPEHLGTHLDAPIHFGEGRWTSAEIPLERMFAPGIVIDISAAAQADADTTLDPDDIAAWEQNHGTVPAGAIVLVRSGWSSRWPDWNAYYGSDTPQDVGTLHFPGVSPEAAELLVERGIAGIGIDTASIDPGPSSDFKAHQILAAANIFNLENLTGLGALPADGFGVIALPMKIADGTGGPARVVAMVSS